MRVLLATEAGSPDRPNEDFAAVTPRVAVLLDGAGLPGAETGCVHGVAWYARTLGGLLAAGACDHGRPLTGVLRHCIGQAAGLHAGTCDLSHPRTPGATVVVAREAGGVLEYLVLADSLLLLQPLSGDIRVVTDTALADTARRLRAPAGALPEGSPARQAAIGEYRRALTAARNQPGGYWLAAADPAAAGHAVTGQVPLTALRSITLLSDGAARLAGRFGLLTWPQTLALLSEHGPGELIRQVRAAEASDPAAARWPRTKASDDATVIHWRITG